MSQGLFTSIKSKCAAFSVAVKEGIRVFRALCSASSSSGTFEPLKPVLIDSDHFYRYDRELLGALGKDVILNIQWLRIQKAGTCFSSQKITVSPLISTKPSPQSVMR